MSRVSLEMGEVLKKAKRFDALSDYSFKLLESANKAMVLNEKSKVLLEECLKELQYLQYLIHGQEALQDTTSVQNGDAQGNQRKDRKTKKDDSR